jgi:hypothetical protein
MENDLWHHLCLTSGQSEVLFTGAEENLNMPSTAIMQYDFSIGKGQIIGEEILDSARLLMFVVLDNSKRSCAKTWVLHFKLFHICIQFTIVMAPILGHLLDFLFLLSIRFMDNPCVISQPGDEFNTQFIKETQILFGGVPVVKRQIREGNAMTNHIVDQDARYLVLGPVFSNEIPMMPECEGYRDVDGSICPDDNYNAMATDVTFICVVIVHVCASHESREWLGNNCIIQDYVSTIVDASDKKECAGSHV